MTETKNYQKATYASTARVNISSSTHKMTLRKKSTALKADKEELIGKPANKVTIATRAYQEMMAHREMPDQNVIQCDVAHKSKAFIILFILALMLMLLAFRVEIVLTALLILITIIHIIQKFKRYTDTCNIDDISTFDKVKENTNIQRYNLRERKVAEKDPGKVGHKISKSNSKLNKSEVCKDGVRNSEALLKKSVNVGDKKSKDTESKMGHSKTANKKAVGRKTGAKLKNMKSLNVGQIGDRKSEDAYSKMIAKKRAVKQKEKPVNLGRSRGSRSPKPSAVCKIVESEKKVGLRKKGSEKKVVERIRLR